jgi:putative copper export protein
MHIAEFPSTMTAGSLPVMATDKRERQRAARAEKQAAEAKVKRRQDALAIVKRYAGYAALIVIALLVITFIGNG